MKIFNGVKQFNKAFTLIELIIVIAIIAILSVIAFPYYQPARKQLALQRSANKLAQDIRRAQGMALGAEAEGVGGEVPEGGYGIYLRSTVQESYVLFADIDDDQKCNGCDSESGEFIERISFESGVEIQNLDNPFVNIIFKPPDPEVYLTNNGNQDLGSQTSIVICLIDDESETKTIKVNKAGLIYVK